MLAFGTDKPEAIGFGYIYAASGARTLIRCYDCGTGAVLWEMQWPETLNMDECASADLDGDGRDEAIFAGGNSLYRIVAAPDGASGEFRWKVGLPAKAGPPAIVDFDGSRTASIMLAAADAYVYCIA